MNRLLGVGALLLGCSSPTICATREAQKLDPTLNAVIADAVDYWERHGHSGLVATDGHNCDVPVRPAGMAYDTRARAMTTEYLTGGCDPEYVEINTRRWDETVADGAQLRVMTHEVGHLYCLPDGDSGVMSTKIHIAEIEASPPKAETKPAPEPDAEPPVKDSGGPVAVCVSSDAVVVDPKLDQSLSDAFAFWAGDESVSSLRYTAPGSCAVQVAFADVSDTARAVVDDCAPEGMQLNQDAWLALDTTQRVYALAHSLGHMACLGDTAAGIMAPDFGVE